MGGSQFFQRRVREFFEKIKIMLNQSIKIARNRGGGGGGG